MSALLVSVRDIRPARSSEVLPDEINPLAGSQSPSLPARYQSPETPSWTWRAPGSAETPSAGPGALSCAQLGTGRPLPVFPQLNVLVQAGVADGTGAPGSRL